MTSRSNGDCTREKTKSSEEELGCALKEEKLGKNVELSLFLALLTSID